MEYIWVGIGGFLGANARYIVSAQVAQRLGVGFPDFADLQLSDLAGRITVAALAREAGVHRVVLARAFRDHFGEPVSVTARRLRIETAVRLLAGSTTPISHVAFHAGFSDQAHLTRAVRGSLGVTPGALRRARLPLFKTSAVPVG